MITHALLLLGLAFGTDAQQSIRPEPCDTSTDQLSPLIRYARLLQVDSFFVAYREQWGWSSKPGSVTAVRDRRLCRRAAEALVHDRYTEARQGVALVRVGTGYIARPAAHGDVTIVLDKNFRILGRIVVPS